MVARRNRIAWVLFRFRAAATAIAITALLLINMKVMNVISRMSKTSV
jgi:hypothetical protein